MSKPSVLSKFTQPLFEWAAVRYQAMVGKELKKYGLRHDDLLDPTMDLDVREALKRIPQAEIEARNQRIKRAMDLSMKHKYLDKEMQAKQTPFKSYLLNDLQQVQTENHERATLGGKAKYNRQLP
mmetsp:Transcript_9203/g.10630  ORF Transcript_9203/g.10630 Transcript_9203/m.10630 type:complete len:125 (-) Transcript_9203:99-473(-)